MLEKKIEKQLKRITGKDRRKAYSLKIHLETLQKNINDIFNNNRAYSVHKVNIGRKIYIAVSVSEINRLNNKSAKGDYRICLDPSSHKIVGIIYHTANKFNFV